MLKPCVVNLTAVEKNKQKEVKNLKEKIKNSEKNTDNYNMAKRKRVTFKTRYGTISFFVKRRR